MAREASPFHQMARLVLVRDLITPLGLTLEVSQGTDDASHVIGEDAFEKSYDPMDRIFLVTDGEVGEWWVRFEMLDAGKRVGECAEAIQPSSILSADTSALEAVGVLERSRHDFFFVLDHDRITGTLHFSDFFKLPFRLCLFALVLELEQSALRLIAQNPRESWQSLSDDRRRQAEEVYQQRHGCAPNPEHPPFADLLDCTMFCDKGTVLRERRLLPCASREAIKRVFDRAQKVRNYCAHITADDYGEPPIREHLADFLTSVQQMISDIEAARLKS